MANSYLQQNKNTTITSGQVAHGTVTGASSIMTDDDQSISAIGIQQTTFSKVPDVPTVAAPSNNSTFTMPASDSTFTKPYVPIVAS